MAYSWPPDMDLRLLATGAIDLLVVGWCLAHEMRKSVAEPSPPLALGSVMSSDPVVCAQIIACTGYDNTEAKNTYSRVKSRAIPNERLVRAFEIDNAFTTSDDDRRVKFKDKARKAIKLTDAEWKTVAQIAKELIRQASNPSKLNTAGQEAPVGLESLVRSVCLKVVLHEFFKVVPFELDEDIISTITTSINSLWIQSKGKGAPAESDKDALHEALAQVLPNLPWSTNRGNRRDNPLNLIIPAYEAMWRVVLSGFIHVTFVKPASPMLKSVLAQFLANPTKAARHESLSDREASALSVDHIVMEIQRLYPSVKRVYRQFLMDNKPAPEDVAADIETCQRSEALWGQDAQHFDPTRWIHASDKAQYFMAFGSLPFVCPAKAEFGPMMIGILVAAFADGFPAENWHLKLGEGSSVAAQRDFENSLNGEMPLVSDRNSFAKIEIIRK